MASDDAVVAALRDSVREAGGSLDVVVEARQLADALAGVGDLALTQGPG